MKKFIGTKMVIATPMNRQQYNDYRDWPLPDDEDGADDGYLVEYTDGGKPNHPNHTGYISWSPKEQFDAAYRPTDGLTFGLAIEALKLGKRVARSSWDSNTWLILTSNRIIKAFTDGSMSFGVQVSIDELFAEMILLDEFEIEVQALDCGIEEIQLATN